MKAIWCGLAALFAVSPVFAGEQYAEVWNPPEARGGVQQIQPAHKPPKHRRASAHMPRPKAHRHIVTALPAAKAGVASTASHASRLTFDDIPRQITPEGNVLRVHGGQTRVEVER